MGWARRLVGWFRRSEAYWSVAGLMLGFLATMVSWLEWATQHALLGAVALLAWSGLQAGWHRVSRGRRVRPRREGENAGTKIYWAALSTFVGAALPALGIENNVAPWALGLLGVVLIPGLAIATWGWWQRHRPRRRWRWEAGRDGNPYPLLTAYTESRARVFFGREDEVDAVMARAQGARGWKQRFIPVIGRSGFGKSSIVRAGVLPQLNSRLPRPFSWLIDALGGAAILGPVTPGDRPVARLAALLSADDADLAAQIAAEAARQGEAARHGQSTPPAALLTALTKRRGWRPRLVIVVDQLEEAARPGGEPELLAYLSLLKAAVSYDDKTVVIATVRSDLLGTLLGGPTADLFEDPLIIRPMERAELLRVIHGPAVAARVRLQTGLAEKMLGDTDDDDALALLSFVLHQLWDAQAPYLADGWLKRDEYDHVGGRRALSRHADDAVNRLISGPLAALPPGQARALVLDTLLEAIAIDGTTIARRRFATTDLAPLAQVIVAALADPTVGLLVHPNGESSIAEIAHEVVLRRWDALAAHAEINRDALTLRSRMERRATEWNAMNQVPELLLRGAELRAARLSPLLQHGVLAEFLDASSVADTDENERLADAAANQALMEVDHDPERAMRIARAAASLAPTQRVHIALYRASRAGHRGRLTGHADTVVAVAWCPAGNRLATASTDETVRLWSPDGDLLVTLTGHTGGVNTVAWSPDGILASGSRDRTVRLWSADGALLHIMNGDDRQVRTLAFSPDGAVLATGGDDGIVRLWTGEGTLLTMLTGHTAPVVAVAWSSDGTRLASSGFDSTARLWSADGAPIATLNNQTSSVAWNPRDGQVATAGSDGTVHLWSPRGAAQTTLKGHTNQVLALAFSPDGARLATASSDRTVRLWPLPGASFSVTVSKNIKEVRAMAWSPDSTQLATAGSDGSVRLWSPNGTPLTTLAGHTNQVRALAFSPDSTRLASTSDDTTVRLWSPGGTPLTALTGHTNQVRALAFSPNSTRLASASHDGTVRLWSPQGTHVITLAGHAAPVRGLAWSSDETCLATASDDATVRLWSPDGTAQAILVGHGDWVRALAFSPDSTRLATASHDGTARLWSPRGTHLATLAGHTGPIWELAWSPDSAHLATASDDTMVRLWSTDGTLVSTLIGHTNQVRAVAFSPDGSRLATASSDGTARLWSANGAPLTRLTGHTNQVRALAFSPDGSRLATASYDHTVRLWSPDGTCVATLTGHTNWVVAVRFSPDGTYLASAGADHTVRLWTADGIPLATLTGHIDQVWTLAFSPDNKHLASAGTDNAVRLWSGPYGFDELVSLVDSLPGLGEITDAERRLASLPPRPRPAR